MPLINLADQVRDIPVAQILESEGFASDRQGQSIMFKNDLHAINVTGQKWFDHKNRKGGFGAIDLAMHLNQTDFRKACVWLADRHGTNAQTPLSFPVAHSKAASPSSAPSESFPEQRARLAIDAPEKWGHVHDYLTQTRGIDPALIDPEVIKATHSKDLPMLTNATFLHRNLDGEIRGLSSRSTLHQTGMKSALGSKTFAWFYLGNPKTADTLILTESPIEALSLAQLAPQKGLLDQTNTPCFLSLGGNSLPENLAQFAAEGRKNVVLALNSDVEGVNGTSRALKTLKDLGFQGDLRILVPEGKDWNHDLIRIDRERIQTLRETTLVSELLQSGEITKAGNLYHRGTSQGQVLKASEPTQLISPTDKTHEQIRQAEWQKTMNEARRHKAILLLERAQSAGFSPSQKQTEDLVQADWRTLKQFEHELKSDLNPFKPEPLTPSSRVQIPNAFKPSRSLHP